MRECAYGPLTWMSRLGLHAGRIQRLRDARRARGVTCNSLSESSELSDKCLVDGPCVIDWVRDEMVREPVQVQASSHISRQNPPLVWPVGALHFRNLNTSLKASNEGSQTVYILYPLR
jgi:hypothetical protein